MDQELIVSGEISVDTIILPTGTRFEEPPPSWSKEAKELWVDIPEAARAQIYLRERQMERGVKSLKDKYQEIDDAFQPYMDLINRFGKTPGDAVKQLFSWFNALSEAPDTAFPALIDSYKYDPARIVNHYWPGIFKRLAQLEQYVRGQDHQQQLIQELRRKLALRDEIISMYVKASHE